LLWKGRGCHVFMPLLGLDDHFNLQRQLVQGDLNHSRVAVCANEFVTPFFILWGKLEGVELQVSQLGTQSEIAMEYGVFVDVTVFCPGSIA